MKFKNSILWTVLTVLLLMFSFAFGADTANSYTGDVGKAFSLVGSAEGNPEPTFTWKKNGVFIPGATTATLSFPSPIVADSGAYVVVATNPAGSAQSSPDFIITIVVPTSLPVIATQPRDTKPIEGTAASLSVVATGIPAPTYQWRKDGANLAGATSATLSFASIKRTDSGLYDVVITNTAGSVTSALAAVDVLWIAKPVIKVGLVDRQVNRGQDVKLEIVAEGADRYAWTDNKGRRMASTGPSVTFRPSNPSWAGWYRVDVFGPPPSNLSVFSEAYISVR